MNAKLLFLLSGTALLAGQAALAQDAAPWWPFAIEAAKGGDLEAVESIEYEPLEKADQKFKLCVLLPHLQDSYWVSVNYGLVEEARRQGVAMSVYQAGGYSNLPRQISQYDDCVASGADAILIGAISEAGVAAKIGEGMEKGIVNIAVANPILDTPITARITPDFYQKGFQTGEFAKEYLDGESAVSVGFPGPQGSGWAETYMSGYRDSVKDSNIDLVAEMYGEASVPAQLRLVEDALQTYPDLKVIWGGAPTAEAAIGAVADAGLDDALIVASYENQQMLRFVKDGDVKAFATEYPVMMGRISVDLAVRALEGKEYEQILLVTPGMVTADNIDSFDTTQIFAPEGFQPVFSVD
ncbi:TMAO reductase system periplasmic protein TorT [Poseidonocella sp. HB161398]|uniref:TMAO reductase system periplasmic protein TorT n=1 Tax=Poseidonocella sp. HB161398 TaxID=2320855 RepID=UPI001108922C|nr:TMAO reductase system periplasmic protein TorT [Poseidonocella sp. HB161398]